MRNALGLVSLVVVSALALACESRISLGGRCMRREECAALLTCVGSVCREECRGPNECPSGQRCIAGPSGLRACSQPVEETCSATDPCNPEVFAECRAGQCVTGCTVGTDCVSGTCDTSAAVGICIETVSTGGADAGPLDAATSPDAAIDDANAHDSGMPCLEPPPSSSRTLTEVVFGAAGPDAAEDSRGIWMETPGASLDLADTFVELAIGVHAEGPMGPGVLAAVNLGPHDITELERAIVRATPFTSSAATDAGELESANAMSAFSVHSGPDFAHLAVLRPEPESLAAAFAWIVTEGRAATGLSGSRSTFPGRVALLAGPDVEFAREILVLDELLDGEHFISIVGEPFGEGNSDQTPLPDGWTNEPFSMSPARQAVLMRQPTSRRTLLARCVGVEGAHPLLTLSELTLPSDDAPALLATAASPDVYRAVTRARACDELPISDITCTGSSCRASLGTTAIDASGATAFEATSWGAASVVSIVDPVGARVVVLDADGDVLTAPLQLDASEMLGLDTVTLREAHVAGSLSGDVAVLALGGLYEDPSGGGHVLVRVLRLTRP